MGWFLQEKTCVYSVIYLIPEINKLIFWTGFPGAQGDKGDRGDPGWPGSMGTSGEKGIHPGMISGCGACSTIQKIFKGLLRKCDGLSKENLFQQKISPVNQSIFQSLELLTFGNIWPMLHVVHPDTSQTKISIVGCMHSRQIISFNNRLN